MKKLYSFFTIIGIGHCKISQGQFSWTNGASALMAGGHIHMAKYHKIKSNSQINN